jgi:hypothetical protein
MTGGTAVAVPLGEALEQGTITCKATGDGRSQVTLQLSNAGTGKLKVELAAGSIFKGEGESRVATIRQAALEIEAGHSAEASIPAVPLSAKNGAKPGKLELTRATSAELQPLLEYSARRDDLPRATAQVAALLLTENIKYAEWVAFLRAEPTTEARPTPTDVVAAVDGLAIARELRPQREFALYQDAEFRLKAVRNPWSRAKAMQLFAMAAPEGVVAPDIGQLLHSKPGDNCPICRMRTKAEEQSANGL